jgi:hypothetical protein
MAKFRPNMLQHPVDRSAENLRNVLEPSRIKKGASNEASDRGRALAAILIVSNLQQEMNHVLAHK